MIRLVSVEERKKLTDKSNISTDCLHDGALVSMFTCLISKICTIHVLTCECIEMKSDSLSH